MLYKYSMTYIFEQDIMFHLTHNSALLSMSVNTPATEYYAHFTTFRQTSAIQKQNLDFTHFAQ